MAEAGFDFIEWPMSRTVGTMDEAAFAGVRDLAASLSITPEAWNVMLPPALKVVGPDVDTDAFTRYVETAFTRAATLGGEVVVFGSGGARSVPEGWDHQEAIRQFEDACRIAGDTARRHGLTIAIEPLNTAETNLVTSVDEGAAIVDRLRHPAIRLLSDLYHVKQEGEPMADTGRVAAKLAHVHIAAPHSRTLPEPGEHDAVYDEWFATLERAGYNGRISLECREVTPDAAARSLAWLRARRDTVAG